MIEKKTENRIILHNIKANICVNEAGILMALVKSSVQRQQCLKVVKE